ncbi:hypothetical protein P3X46_011372 [Hevea brasiliensis]|uniref:HTH myb-type domain-containing protein n=1 Tax=Hevea brasiliensis TaxID=3981 RepID=A0ABQ9MHB0_HEVBR|nr:hypothetical protein P3X46_011372 [Hevea brasiliensis]
MIVDEASCSSLWTREQDKAFENAFATYAEDIKLHYELLVEDLNQIEAGCVPLPNYSSSEGSMNYAGNEGTSKKGGHLAYHNNEFKHGNKASRSDQERRKGIAWTEEEHSLDKYGKGDWQSISRNFVMTRTPTQVASHTQKYFIRLISMNKDRRQSNIHDITSVGNGDISAPQRPITGQANGSIVGGVVMYGPPIIGQLVRGPFVSAVGTPVNLLGPAYMAYGFRAPIPGVVVPGAIMNLGLITYPMPSTTTHR